MPSQPKKTNVKASHKDSAAKNTMNPPSRRGGTQSLKGTEEQDPTRRGGQFTDSGQPPNMKK